MGFAKMFTRMSCLMTETEGFVRLIETMFTYMAVHVQPKAFSTHTLIMLSTYTHITI